MNYPLKGLLDIRGFREDAAAKNIAAAEAALQAALAAALAAREELERYRQWREMEIERRYLSIMGREMSLKDLDEFKDGLARLDDQELLKHQAVEEAEKRTDEARRNLASAKEALAAAVRAKQKIVHHRDQWLEADAREENRQQDLEMEEFKPVLFE